MMRLKLFKDLLRAQANFEKYKGTKDKALLNHLKREMYLKKMAYDVFKFLEM